MRLRTVVACVVLIPGMAVPAAAQMPLRLDSFIKIGTPAAKSETTAVPRKRIGTTTGRATAFKPARSATKSVRLGARKPVRSATKPTRRIASAGATKSKSMPLRLADHVPALRTQQAERPSIVAAIIREAAIANALASSARPADPSLVPLASPEQVNELDLLADAVQIVAEDEVNVIDLVSSDIMVGQNEAAETFAGLQHEQPSWLDRIKAALAGWFAAASAFFVG
jgi:hypothetical protein